MPRTIDLAVQATTPIEVSRRDGRPIDLTIVAIQGTIDLTTGVIDLDPIILEDQIEYWQSARRAGKFDDEFENRVHSLREIFRAALNEKTTTPYYRAKLLRLIATELVGAKYARMRPGETYELYNGRILNTVEFFF